MTASPQSQSPARREEFWSRLWVTPLEDLLRGEVTGACSPRRVIDAAGLPQPVADAIWNEVSVRSRLRSRRLALARNIIAWSQAQLEAGHPATDVAAAIPERADLLAKLDVKQIISSTLSPALGPELCRILRDVAGRARGLTRQRDLVLALDDRFRVELAAGKGAEEIAVKLGEAAQLIPLVNRLPAKLVVFESQLPASLLRLVSRVVTRTRLWPSERSDVACELCAHFADGLSSGNSAAELERSFGSADVAAQLIRRAKLRNRPLAWQVWYQSRRAAVVMFAIISLLWIGLIVRFHTGKPSITRDFLAEFDAQQAKIPVADRAWPLYRQGLIMLDRAQWEGHPTLDEAFDAGPSHAEWPEVKRFLAENQELLKIFAEATKRPQLGYQYRDPQNDDWLRVASPRQTSAQLYPPGKVLASTTLPQYQDLRMVQMMFRAATLDALEAEDAPKLTELLHARFGLVRQLWCASRFPVTDIYPLFDLSSLSKTIIRVLEQKPELLDDREIRSLARVLATACDDSPRLRYEGGWLMVVDFLQQAYTGNDKTDGRMTAAGSEVLRSFFLYPNGSSAGLIGLWQLGFQEPHMSTFVGALKRELAGSALAALVADRREIAVKMQEMFNLFVVEQERPYWQREPSKYDAEIARLRADPRLSVKFAPLLLVLPSSLGTDWRTQKIDLGTQTTIERDAALIALAKELFRRREGRLPEGLEELVPAYLAQIPIDPLTGVPRR